VLASAVLVHHKHTGIARVGDPVAVRRPNRILQVARPHRQPLKIRAIRRRRIDIRRRRPIAYEDNPPHGTRKGRQSRRHRHTNKTHDDQNEQAASVHAETPRDSSRRGRARRLSEQTHHRRRRTASYPPIERATLVSTSGLSVRRSTVLGDARVPEPTLTAERALHLVVTVPRAL
jgi:hypothetical protein